MGLGVLAVLGITVQGAMLMVDEDGSTSFIRGERFNLASGFTVFFHEDLPSKGVP